jgi:hypothetical protein
LARRARIEIIGGERGIGSGALAAGEIGPIRGSDLKIKLKREPGSKAA